MSEICYLICDICEKRLGNNDDHFIFQFISRSQTIMEVGSNHACVSCCDVFARRLSEEFIK